MVFSFPKFGAWPTLHISVAGEKAEEARVYIRETGMKYRQIIEIPAEIQNDIYIKKDYSSSYSRWTWSNWEGSPEPQFFSEEEDGSFKIGARFSERVFCVLSERFQNTLFTVSIGGEEVKKFLNGETFEDTLRKETE